MNKPMLLIIFLTLINISTINPQDYPIVDTGQENCYDTLNIISCPQPGEPFFEQDAQYSGNQPSYTDNGDGTIIDNVTGLMWQKSFITLDWGYTEDSSTAATTGGYNDWRVPTIKELY